MSLTSSPAEVEDLIDSQRRRSGIGISVLVICFLALAAEGLDAASLQYMAPAISAEFGLNSSQMGIAFSAGFAGMLLGGAILGPLADRWGRRPVVLLALVITAAGSLTTIFADSLSLLIVARAVTGIGIGATVPSALALVGDFAPSLSRTRRIILVGTGVTLGTAIAPPLSVLFLSTTGWHGIFILGTVWPALLAIAAVALLPESPRVLLRRGKRIAAVKVLHRLHPEQPTSLLDNLSVPSETRVSPRWALFGDKRTPATILLWAVFALTFGSAYMGFSWIPTILVNRGVPIEVIGTIAVGLGVGSILGSIILALLARGRRTTITFAAALGVAALVAPAFILAGSTAVAIVAIFLFGVGMTAGGLQTGLNGLAGEIYPPEGRATGIGFSTAFGRLGSIVFPLIGGILLATDPAGVSLFTVGSVAFAVAGLLLVILALRRRTTPVAPASPTPPRPLN